MLGSINIKLRPIKIAFLVKPNDPAGVLEAIQLSSLLWGGIYNPIVPVAKRIPAAWTRKERFTGFQSNAKKITLGYLDTFDPDYFLPLSGCNIDHLGLDAKRIVTAKDIVSTMETEGLPGYGVGLFELLNHFIREELRFVRRRRLEVALPKVKRDSELFLASVFGMLPPALDEVLRSNYREQVEGAEDTANIESYATLLKPSTLFLRRFTSLHIDARPGGGAPRAGACLFFLDADNPYDVLDYWNLRAIGWRVLPIAKQATHVETVRQLAIEFINGNYGPSRYNPEFYFNTTVLSARSVADGEAEAFVNSLRLPVPKAAREAKVQLQHWYPRIWDEWARDKDGVGGCDLEAGEADVEFSDGVLEIRAKTVDPPFIARFGGDGTPRFANALTFHLYGARDLPAQVLPAGGGIDLIRAVGGLEPDAWRCSRRELVYLSRHAKWSIHAAIPAASDVFSAWMKAQGLPVAPSTPGKIAQQMVNRLGGIHGLSVLSHEPVLDLLRKMEGGKVVSKDDFFAGLAKAASSGRLLVDRARLADWLLRSGMIRLGAELQCPTCQQRPWYGLEDLGYRLQCHNCFQEFDVPAATPDRIKWAYRAFGPFSLPGRAYGVYSVLLTLRFFGQLLRDRSTTPMLSFLAKRDGREMEIDLGLFFKETRFGVADTELIFAECKSYTDEFERADVEKLSWLGAKFPGSVLLFATLRRKLTEREKRLIGALARKGRREWKTERPHNPVLVLTATELLTDWGPPECWKDAGGPYQPFAEQYRRSRCLGGHPKPASRRHLKTGQ